MECIIPYLYSWEYQYNNVQVPANTQYASYKRKRTLIIKGSSYDANNMWGHTEAFKLA